MDIHRLLEISEVLGQSGLISSLKELEGKEDSLNCPLVLPLIGEFSAGKTTLLNSLMDDGSLETGYELTTATIYEIYFGQKEPYAEVIDSKGNSVDVVSSFQELKNDKFSTASLIRVFDTSKRVPSSVVLVDTPGLSSPNPKHRQALVDYFPKADGILLVCNVTQNLTASLLDFVNKMKLANRSFFLVLTQCDYMAQSEVENARKCAASVSGIPESHIACISAKDGQMDEFFGLLALIQKDKFRILKEVCDSRMTEIKNRLLIILDQMIRLTKQDSDFSEVISEKQRKIDGLKREIASLIDSATSEIEDEKRVSIQTFKEMVSDQLDSVAASNGINYDAEAKAVIDTAARVLLNDFKTAIQGIISRKAREKFSSDESIDLSGLLDIDLGEITVGELPYNLNLNGLGHEYDSTISTGIKVAAAVAMAVAVVATGGGAAGGAAGAAGSASATGVAGTASAAGAAGAASATGAVTVGSSVATATTAATTTATTIANAANGTAKVATALATVNTVLDQAQKEYDGIQERGQGGLERFVGVITDRSIGKPHRKEAIDQFVDGILAPSYKTGMQSITTAIINAFSDAIQLCASSRLKEFSEALRQAREEQFENETAYRDRIHQLKEYQNELLNA